MMKSYSVYKDSGIEWIGKIPKGWGVSRLKYIDKCVMGQSPDSEECNKDRVGIPFLQGNADFMTVNPAPSVWCEETNKLAEPDDILLSVRAPVGSVNIADQVYGIGRGLCAIRARLSHKRYLYFKALCLLEELNSIATGSTYTAVSVEQVSNVFLPHPSYDEQDAIADYLDCKTAQIDDLITKKERMIGLLKEERAAVINQVVTKGLNPNVEMKDSGVNWIGRIPVSWEIKKLKYVLRNFDGKRVPLSAEERSGMQGEYPYYGSNGIVGWVNDYLFDGEYILLGEDGAPFFELYKDVAFLVRGRFWVNNHAHILKADHRYSHRFLTYALNRVDYRRHITGSTRDKLTQDDMSVIESPIPNLAEQETISDYLDKKTTQIDGQISLEERSIELLKEYRTVLIAEAVTGKIDVRGS